jgi:hypothetical protein
LGGVPYEELEWLVAHGTFNVHEAGHVIGSKGTRIERLWLIVSGHVAIRVDRGVGPRLVTEWHAGEVTGMLPYSRMTGPPGDNYCAEKTELLGSPLPGVHGTHGPHHARPRAQLQHECLAG